MITHLLQRNFFLEFRHNLRLPIGRSPEIIPLSRDEMSDLFINNDLYQSEGSRRLAGSIIETISTIRTPLFRERDGISLTIFRPHETRGFRKTLPVAKLSPISARVFLRNSSIFLIFLYSFSLLSQKEYNITFSPVHGQWARRKGKTGKYIWHVKNEGKPFSDMTNLIMWVFRNRWKRTYRLYRCRNTRRRWVL